ncbi:bifunctional aminoglycoside phosphotransferase/ATP-binding protein [Hydrogenophaga sp. BPS33]|uniref:bifunctional aminoglycoside phosphotransferase/ATP-binding protein n=1 Tax=Hydrogenophaga sp. BPS33 TaxID=2651974 RepID=UPI002E2A616E|nr:AAA family ATPase [Hydrogenophaga sp. BPS33]
MVASLSKMLSRETGQPVELIETHISWVLLTPIYAYKLKKPVRFPFVDFSSVDARKHFCEEELRLNQRFAPPLYIDVLPVYGSPESPRMGGIKDGMPIDHVIRMRRFPQSSLLRNLLESGRIEPAWLDGLASRMAEFHASAPAVSPASPIGGPDMIVRKVTDVLTSLQERCEDSRHVRLHGWMNEQARALRPAWTARQRGGWIRECHGDLHTGNVVLIEGELVPFDCIEFDPGLRWIDVMSDIAFLTMDLKAHGRRDLAFRFLDEWLQRSGDHAGLQVLHFYEVYRALVRAMTSGLGKQSSNAASRPDYLARAAEWAASPRDNARLLITHGFSGSGKSTVASQLLRAAGAVRIRSDVERKRLFGLDPQECSTALGLDIYTEQATNDTFESLRKRASDALRAGYPVIVDAAFLQSDWRRRFQALAEELHVPFSILDCHASPSKLRHRVMARAATGLDASEAGVEVLEHQLATHQPLETDEQAFTMAVSTQDTVDIDSLAAKWGAARALASDVSL